MRKEMPAMHIALCGVESHVHVVCCICMILMIYENGYGYVCLRDMIVLYVGCKNPLFYSLCILNYGISVLTPLLFCVICITMLVGADAGLGSDPTESGP